MLQYIRHFCLTVESLFFSSAVHDISYLWETIDIFSGVIIVNFQNIWTPKTFVVITLNFELCGSTIE